MTPLDAFNWAFDKITRDHQTIHRAEEKRLDPPADPHTISCLYCEGWGYYKQRHCASVGCNFRRYCPCPCQNCAYIECDPCNGSGEMVEPLEWREKE